MQVCGWSIKSSAEEKDNNIGSSYPRLCNTYELEFTAETTVLADIYQIIFNLTGDKLAEHSQSWTTVCKYYS